MATGLQQRQWGALVDALYALDAGDPWIGQTIDPSPQPKKASAKYSDDEARDDHGRWTYDGGGVDGGGDGSSAAVDSSSSVTVAVNKAVDAVLARGRDGHEYGAQVERPSGRTSFITDGERDSIEIPKNSPTMDPSARVTFVHNHPLGMALSTDDLGVLASHPGMVDILAVDDEGGRYEAARTASTPVWQDVQNYGHEAAAGVRDVFNSSLRDGKMDVRAAEQLHTLAVNQALANAGMFRFHFKPGATMRLIMNEFSTDYAKAVAEGTQAVTRYTQPKPAKDAAPDALFIIDDSPPDYSPPTAEKYTDDEARDDHGRWTDSGGQNDVVVPGHPAGPEHGPGSTPVGGTANDTVGPTPTGGAFHADEFFGRLSEADGGFTVQPLTGNEPHGAGNYAVSIYPERGKVFDPGTLTPTDLYTYVRDNAAYFARPDHYLGAWHDPVTGKIYADISVVTQDAQRAADLARTHNQLAYFDLGTLASVRVDSPHLAGHKDARHGAGSEAGDHRRARAPGAIRRRPGRGVHETVHTHDGPDADAGTGRRAAAADPRRSTVDAIMQRAAQAHVFGKQPDTLDLATAPAPTRIAASMEPDLARAITGAFTAAREALDLPALTAAIKDGDHHAAATLVRAAGANDRLKAAYHPRVAAAFLRGAHLAATHLGILLRATTTLTLDAVHAAALDWASQHAGELVLTDADVQEIINILVQGSVAGEATPQELAVAIRSAIGLLPRQVQATATYQQTLLAAGTAPEVVAARVASYVDEQIASRAMTISRTELIGALNGGQQELWNQAVSDGTLDPAAMHKVWIVTDDERLCPICADLDGEQVDISDEFSSGDMTPPDHPNCLTGDAHVLPGSRIAGATKRWFDGDVVVIGVAGDRRLTCTPNHPVLTPRGWVAARLLNVGGDVVCDRRSQWGRSGNGDHEQMPARIEDVAHATFRSLEMVPRPMPVAAKDFHGDGAGSDVAIVVADRLRDHHGDTTHDQHVSEFALVAAAGDADAFAADRALPKVRIGSMRSAHRSMGGNDLALTSRMRHPRPFDAFGIGLRPKLDAAFAQVAINDASTDAELARQLIDGCAVPVGLAEILTIETMSFHGFVYNMETEDGWYAAESIVTHNCRCAIGLVRAEDDGAVDE